MRPRTAIAIAWSTLEKLDHGKAGLRTNCSIRIMNSQIGNAGPLVSTASWRAERRRRSFWSYTIVLAA